MEKIILYCVLLVLLPFVFVAFRFLWRLVGVKIRKMEQDEFKDLFK